MTVDVKIKNVVKHLYLTVHYSAILYRKLTKPGIQEEQLLLHLDTRFSWIPLQTC